MKRRTINGMPYGVSKRIAAALDAERAAAAAATEQVIVERSKVRASLLVAAHEFGADVADTATDHELRVAIMRALGDSEPGLEAQSQAFLEGALRGLVADARKKRSEAESAAARAAADAADAARGEEAAQAAQMRRLQAARGQAHN